MFLKYGVTYYDSFLYFERTFKTIYRLQEVVEKNAFFKLPFKHAVLLIS